MSHPFEKLFERALKASLSDSNEVLEEAEKLREKGYPPAEIYAVLLKLKNSLIDSKEEEVVEEAVDEFSRYLDV